MIFVPLLIIKWLAIQIFFSVFFSTHLNFKYWCCLMRMSVSIFFIWGIIRDFKGRNWDAHRKNVVEWNWFAFRLRFFLLKLYFVSMPNKAIDWKRIAAGLECNEATSKSKWMTIWKETIHIQVGKQVICWQNMKLCLKIDSLRLLFDFWSIIFLSWISFEYYLIWKSIE